VADGFALRCFVGGGLDRGLNVGVRHTAGAEVAGDAEFSLAADFGALAGELLGVAGVVELAVFFHAGKHDLRKELVRGAAVEQALHFFYGVGAAHQGAEGDVVEFLFGVDFAAGREHNARMMEGVGEVKRERSNEIVETGIKNG